MENLPEHSPFLPPSPESGTDSDDDNSDKKKKKSRALSFSQKEQLRPGKDDKSEKIAASVEALLWRREENKADKKGEPSKEIEGEISLTDDEAKIVAIEHVEERQEEVRSELKSTKAGTEEEVVARASEMLLEKDEEHLGNSDESLPEALDAAAAEAERLITAARNTDLNETLQYASETGRRFSVEDSPYSPGTQRIRPEAVESVLQRNTSQPASTGTSPRLASSEWRMPSVGVENAPAPPLERPRKRTFFDYFAIRRNRATPSEQGGNSVRAKLEKQVRRVREMVSTKEWRIRKLAAVHYEQQVAGRPTFAARPTEVLSKAERNPAYVVTKSGPEAALNPQPERMIPLPEQKSVQMMTHKELLKVSEKIIIEGASLRSVYESRRITEKGLRRLVSEYFRGGDMPRRLAKEMIERERDFERDPQLRDHFAGAGIVGGGTEANAVHGMRIAPENSAWTAPKSHATKLSISDVATSPRKLAMAAWITLIVVLAVIAAILLLAKK